MSPSWLHAAALALLAACSAEPEPRGLELEFLGLFAEEGRGPDPPQTLAAFRLTNDTAVSWSFVGAAGAAGAVGDESPVCLYEVLEDGEWRRSTPWWVDCSTGVGTGALAPGESEVAAGVVEEPGLPFRMGVFLWRGETPPPEEDLLHAWSEVVDPLDTAVEPWAGSPLDGSSTR